MPRRKPEPAPKRKAARKSAPTNPQRQEFAEAANSAARAALAPLTAQVEKLSRQITAQQSLVLKDIAAAVRAAAEAQTEYALVLPTPAHALIARNAEHAAQEYPDDHTYTPKPYLSQTSLEDEPQDSAEYYARLTAGVSPSARTLLYLIAGRWADHTYTPTCELDRGKHGEGCKHAARSVPFTLNALARDLYGSTGGKQAAQIAQLLEELGSARISYGITAEIQHPYAEEGSAARPYEPLVVSGLKGIGRKGQSSLRANQSSRLTLSKGLHEEYGTGSYRRIRRALLVGWTEWQQELALRLYSHIGTYYGARRLLRSADKRSGTIRVGRTDRTPMDLGGLAHLLPSHGDNPSALQRKLEEFAAEVNSRSEPTELHIVGITPMRKGRHTEGWALDITYPEQPLTAKQRSRLIEAEQRQQLRAGIAALTAGSRTEPAEQPPEPQRAAVQPLRIEVDSYGNEVVVLPEALPEALPTQEAMPTCSHGIPLVLQRAGVSRAGKPYKAFWQARHKVPSGEWCKEKREGTS
jgi:hypothetical protein